MRNKSLQCVILLSLIIALGGQELFSRQISENRSKLLIKGGGSISKFSTFAFAKEGVIVNSMGKGPFSYNPDEPVVGVIVIDLGNPYIEGESRETLENLRRFVNDGGRSAVLLGSSYSTRNADFQELFSISIVKKRSLIGSIPGTKENDGKRLSIKGDDYCPLFKGLSITGGPVSATAHQLQHGKRIPTRWGYASSIHSYLVAVGEDWVCNFVTVEDKKVCLSAWRKLGKGEILFLISFGRSGKPESFFNDDNIDVGDNMEAAMRLVRWFAAKTPFPVSQAKDNPRGEQQTLSVKPSKEDPSHKFPSHETERIRGQIAEAERELKPFVASGIWRAYQLIQQVLNVKCLESSDPKLVAKAHRVMAGVYYTAVTIATEFPSPFSKPEDVKAQKEVYKLGKMDAFGQTAKHIKESLGLDPKQPDSSELKKAAKELESLKPGEAWPFERFTEVMELLTKK